MLVNTHILLAQHIYDNLELEEKRIINYNSFVYGNIKPDMVSTYKLKKHYMDESLEMILVKIKNLSALTENDINKWISISKFSQEVGVICHFLCDFFCIPHSERWEFKHSMNKHVRYEKDLANAAKTVVLPKKRTDIFGKYDVKYFILKAHEIYERENSYENDIIFASYVCNSIVDYIIQCIEFNSAVSQSLISI
ncbi:zinc dependent phospholipase C family protein [Clostridium massiliamazoniense]|uniref:zinc dependent phospholipase C family protein n=1 Tax=Clostridium massiliamazoniense TaxID=1347366 RepID=UPI0006D7896E|nr:zinc dependent phospholipase C family protein [Clostridium massiliamazoniense]